MIKNKSFKSFLNICSGIYWRTRYELLNFYSHKRLSESHGELIVASNMVYQLSRLKSDEVSAGELHAAVYNLGRQIEKSHQTHKWHCFRPEA